MIYANGLGAVDPPVPLGAAAPPSGPLSPVAAPVTLRIGGLAARVDFAGLVPGFPGLYQLNVVVPAGVTAADEVPVDDRDQRTDQPGRHVGDPVGPGGPL